MLNEECCMDGRLRGCGYFGERRSHRPSATPACEVQVDRSPPRTPCGLPAEGISFHSVRSPGAFPRATCEREGSTRVQKKRKKKCACGG